MVGEHKRSNHLQRTYVTPGPDQNLSLTSSGSTYYYLDDALGSIRQVIDANEATQTRRGGTPRRGRRPHSYDYFAFGKVYGTPTENLTQPFRFTARAWDPESSLYWYRTRNYRPETGRFANRDPVYPLLVLSAYGYVLNRPTVGTDPFGLDIWVVGSGEATEAWSILAGAPAGHTQMFVQLWDSDGNFVGVGQYDFAKGGWDRLPVKGDPNREGGWRGDNTLTIPELEEIWETHFGEPAPCQLTADDITDLLREMYPDLEVAHRPTLRRMDNKFVRWLNEAAVRNDMPWSWFYQFGYSCSSVYVPGLVWSGILHDSDFVERGGMEGFDSPRELLDWASGN